MKKRRVVVTGMGTLNALGVTVDEYWNNLKEGKSGITRVENYDLGGSPSLIGGEIKTDKFNVEDHFERRIARRMDRFCHLGIVAARQAIEQSGLLNYGALNKDKVGVLVASGIGGIDTFMENAMKLMNGSYKKVSPLFIPMLITDITSGHISIETGFRGPNYSISSACASASHGISAAYNHIILGDAEAMVVGGSESTLGPLCFAGFTQAQALATKFNDEPHRGSRPWDKDRDGFVMAEGTGVIVLEEYEHAVKRGAPIFAEMVSYGVSADAHHITAPCPDGAGAALAMKNALEKAEISPRDIQLVNAHGTSTPLGDIAETMAVKSVFGDHAYNLKVNSTKSMVGHTLGAAGGVEAIAVIKMLENGIVHPTINLDDPDPECDLDYVPHKAIDFQAEYAMSNSFGFGGHDVTIIFKRYQG